MEPENTAPAGKGNKKKFLIITLVVILVVAGVALGFLFMLKEIQGQGPRIPHPTVVKKVEAPRVLSKEEKALVEKRMEVSGTVSLTKKEISALGQREQDTKGASTLTEEEKAIIQERILIQ